MDASLRTRAEQLATEFAGQAQTAEDLNGFMRLMMRSALECGWRPESGPFWRPVEGHQDGCRPRRARN